MEEILEKVDELIEKSNNIPKEIKPIVKAICKGYMRESNGRIPIEGIMNVCNTVFHQIDLEDNSFLGENRILGETITNYDDDCNISHVINYVKDPNIIKLISILTHELGHVITEPKPNIMNPDGTYPLVKRTTTVYSSCKYIDGDLRCANQYGYRMADGFLESMSTKIFHSDDFREELYRAGYDLKDYEYKDERLFPSRIYDEYKACFELYDYILNGTLSDFSIRTFQTNEELANYINNNKITVIFDFLDESNDALWKLKPYEGKDKDEIFDELLQDYLDKKEKSIILAEELCKLLGKSLEDKKYQELMTTYKETINKQKELPIKEDSLQSSK